MNYFTTTSNASRRAVDCVIVGVYARGKLGIGAADINASSKGQLSDLVKSGDVSGQLGHCSVLTRVSGVKAARVAVVGLGKPGAFGASQFKKAVAAATNAVSKTKTRQILNCLPTSRRPTPKSPMRSAKPLAYRGRKRAGDRKQRC